MKTYIITGGTQGIGKGIALTLLKQNNRVIVVGHSKSNGENFIEEASNLGFADRAIFIQSDLSLVEANNKLIEQIKKEYPAIDGLIFCAAKHNQKYIETSEGFEFTFALAYLSRYVLGYGLKENLEKTDNPIILNICGTGMNGTINWEDLQHKNKFDPMKVMMHGSRLNDALAVNFSKIDSVGKIKYVLYNPMAVKTPGMENSGMNFFVKFIMNIIAKPVDKAIIPIIELIENIPNHKLISFTQRKENNLSKPTFDTNNAQKLYEITKALLNEVIIK